MENKKCYKKIFLYIITFLILIFLVLLACQSPDTTSGGGGGGGDSGLKINITNVGWIIENIDESFWSSSPGTTCFYDWFVRYEGDNISQSDIQSARIYPLINSNYYWNLIPDPYFFDGTNKIIGGWARWYWGSENHVAPIGNFRVEIILTNGYTTTYNVSFPAPGSTSTNGFNYVYTENIPSPGAVYTPMIHRATIVSYSKTTGINIVFNVNDPLVYSGYVSFHDSDGDWVGSTTEYFRNYETGILNTDLLTTLNIDGTNNTLDISDSEIYYDSGKTFSDIAGFILVLTDGAQYDLQPQTYDCLSRSEKIYF